VESLPLIAPSPVLSLQQGQRRPPLLPPCT
jgi:hypothetical protein